MRLPILLSLFVGCTLLVPISAATAAPKAKSAEIAKMLKDKDTRMMVLHELMSTKERKMEMAKVLKADPEFREAYGNATTGGG